MIADEPTTALDVTVQAQILELLTRLVRDTGMGLILITHDMGVVAETADRVLVMQRGRAVETASVHTLFAAPSNPYTRQLLAAVPRLDKRSGDRAEGAAIMPRREPLIVVERVSKSFYTRVGLFRSGLQTHALDAVSFYLDTGETLALVGESGSGKSTLGRAVARLTDIDRGSIRIAGQDISMLSGAALRKARSHTQMIFQDPYSSLDPRFSIGRTIAEPMRIRGVSGAEARERTALLLDRVGLAADIYDRFPHEFSGGQRQRIAIARALATDPSALVADEPTSALDVSIQARVLELLRELKAERSLALLFISHDLAVVRTVADRVAVMRAGRILETGPTEAVLADPHHRYTRALIASAPIPDPARRSGRRRLEAQTFDAPIGPLREVSPGHWVAA
jgi:ABC-type glutathione transport system ATPase component